MVPQQKVVVFDHRKPEGPEPGKVKKFASLVRLIES
jgi:hypothetical protein